MLPRVYNIRHSDAPADAVYVGRPSPYGNPYRVSEALMRGKAVEQYRSWINAKAQSGLREQMRTELRGCDLVCWCAPRGGIAADDERQICHAQVVMTVANDD